MKKLLSLLLVLTMLFSASLPALAENEREYDPVVIVPGLMESILVTDRGTPEEARFFENVKGEVKANLLKLILGVMLAMFFGKYDVLVSATTTISDFSMRKLAMNPDGTSVWPLTPYETEADRCTLEALKANGAWEHMDYGAQHADAIAEKIGADRVFVFDYDWRLGADDLAERLYGFIADVKTLTGTDKVDVYANSYGCQVLAQYLYVYGGAENIDNLVMNCPAFAGTTLFTDLLSATEKDLDIDYKAATSFMLRLFRFELDLENIVWMLPDRIARRVVYPCIADITLRYLGSAPGLWGCCPTEDYEEMKALLLDPVANAAVIEKSDAIHAGVMSHIREILDAARTAGVDVSIVAGAGTQLMSGNRVDGDATVDTVHATGGKAAKLGETLPDDPDSIHRSPYGTLDVTDGYLPDNTWVVQGMAHGQSAWDQETQQLVLKLLMTHDLPDVYADTMFPQFTDAHCPKDNVSLFFPGTGASVLKASEGEIKASVRNNSEQNTITVTGITVAGGSYLAKGAVGKLAPGESREFTFVPIKPLKDVKTAKVTVYYVEVPAIKIAKSRTVFCAVL